MTPISFTEQENRMLQSILTELYQDDRVRSLSGPIYESMLTKVKAWPATVTFTRQEDRVLQVLFEGFKEQMTPYPYPYSPLTFSQDTRQLSVTAAILAKLEAAR